MSSTEIRIHIFIHEESVAVHEELLLADSQAGGRKRSGFVRSLLLTGSSFVLLLLRQLVPPEPLRRPARPREGRLIKATERIY